MTTSSARRGRHWPQYNVTKSRHSCKLGKETRSPDNVQGNLTSSPCHLLSSCVSQGRTSTPEEDKGQVTTYIKPISLSLSFTIAPSAPPSRHQSPGQHGDTVA
ncbi:uncharacterized protein LOC135089708 isoform X5 [Scylla paramamosain]|uniref:uncharacterized protein LOC135089708 isoform X5 n=1 Tax=Scylla paramamosain TaxID=85552 RepID=UPI003083B1E5